MTGRILDVLVCGWLLAGALPAVAQWQEFRSRHFLVYHQQDQAYARQVAQRAEAEYQATAQALGFTRLQNFWLWENRVKIRIYPDAAEFRQATGAPIWAAGMADYSAREIHGFAGSREFLDEVLTHEIAHLIFRDFVGFDGQVPLWLDEGVAQWRVGLGGAQRNAMLAKMARNGQLYTLMSLTRMTGDQLVDPSAVQRFYLQAASLVEFMIETYGRDRFARFCRQLRDGRSLDEALRFTFPAQVRTLDALEKAWLRHLSH